MTEKMIEFSNLDNHSEKDMLCLEFSNSLTEYYVKLGKSAASILNDKEMGGAIVMTSIVYSITTFLKILSDGEKNFIRNINGFKKHLSLTANEIRHEP